MLEAKGLLTVEDLLAYLPLRYEDRSNLKPIAQLAPGEMATVIAEVKTARMSGFKRRNLGLFEATFTRWLRRDSEWQVVSRRLSGERARPGLARRAVRQDRVRHLHRPSCR